MGRRRRELHPCRHTEQVVAACLDICLAGGQHQEHTAIGPGLSALRRPGPEGSVIGRAQFNYAAELMGSAGKVERIAIMFEDTAYGTSTASSLGPYALKYRVTTTCRPFFM